MPWRSAAALAIIIFKENAVSSSLGWIAMPILPVSRQILVENLAR